MSKLNKFQKLQIEYNNLKASTNANLYYTKQHLVKLSEDEYMASGLVFEIKDLSGNLKANFLVADGLKKDTIALLINEVQKTLKKQTFT